VLPSLDSVKVACPSAPETKPTTGMDVPATSVLTTCSAPLILASRLAGRCALALIENSMKRLVITVIVLRLIIIFSPYEMNSLICLIKQSGNWLYKTQGMNYLRFYIFMRMSKASTLFSMLKSKKIEV
jgi:hypothetical protein